MTNDSLRIQKLEVLDSLSNFVTQIISNEMVTPEDCWQPSDFLPDMRNKHYLDEINEIRERAANIPNTLLISLVGNMITEEALPSYQSWFNLLEGMNKDKNLASNYPWTTWSRVWTSEENRHGDLLNKYLYLTGRVDMKSIEQTIHRLLYNGVDPLTGSDPYNGIIYTSFQERATKISHVNTGKLADKSGDSTLSKICKVIAGDEARHEKSYKTMMSKILEIDPNNGIIAFENMMRNNIMMPARFMDKGSQGNSLFEKYASITQMIGVYTAMDYANIIEHLVKYWSIGKFENLNSKASKAQEYLCNLADRYKKLAERIKVFNEPELIWI
jgi:acyl-[acyl-carrier-protein] desaturase